MAEQSELRPPPSKNEAADANEHPPDMGRSLTAEARRVLVEYLPVFTRHPFFGGQAVTVAVVALVVWLSRALQPTQVALLAIAAIGSILMHTVIGAGTMSASARLRDVVFVAAFVLGAVTLLGPIGVLIVTALSSR